MDKVPIDTRTLYEGKKTINELIKKISIKNTEEKLKSFDAPFYDLRNILEKMGKALYRFVIQYFKDNKVEIDDFKFYFWPGFSTLQDKRVFIWGAETGRKNPHRYYTGIGWDEHSRKFYNCPTTLAYDQVLNNDIFDGSDFFSGSTHHFRINQSKETEHGKDYLALRINCNKDGHKSALFKSLHITMDEYSIKEDGSQHTLHIRIPKTDIKESGFNIRKHLNRFIKENNRFINKNNDIVRDEYLWQWPFDTLICEERLKEKEENRFLCKQERIELCQKHQQEIIDIQTHLYSYWIEETLSDGSTFRNETNKKEFKDKLHRLLKDSNMLYIEELLGFFEKVEEEKAHLKLVSDGNRHYTFKNIYFNHWYTLYHEGVTVKGDLGSTMFLTSHELPHELLYYIASWIEDIYNNLKLVESMAMAEYNTYKMDFHTLYHTQLPYIELFKSCIEKGNNPQDLIPIVEHLRYGLKITRNYSNISKLKEDLDYNLPIDILEVIKQSQIIINVLCKNDNILASLFRINQQDHYILKALAEQNKIITIENESSVMFYTNKEAFEMLINELLFNAIKHSIPDNSNIRIVFASANENEQTIFFYNNSKNSYSEEIFKEILDKTQRQGVRIIKKLAEVLDITLSHSVDNNIVCTTLKFKRHESK
jgi:hypothetical protein